MRLIANCQLHGDYGTVVAGQEFVISDEDGRKLIEEGAARRAASYVYQTKVVVPEAPGVSARPPFRYDPASDEGPPALAAVRDSVRSASKLPEQGNPDPGGRPGRRAPDSK